MRCIAVELYTENSQIFIPRNAKAAKKISQLL